MCLAPPNKKVAQDEDASMKRALFIFAAVIVLPLAAADRPNIVLIYSDDHANNAIGAYRGRLASLNPTPHIDQLAREGMRFDRFYVGNSICGPSRATLLTGKHSHKHGKTVNKTPFDHNQQTFPKLLQAAGYRTALFGKTHLGGEIQGFDTWETFPNQGNYYQPEFDTADGKKQYDGYVADVITRNSINWMRAQRKSGEPFMLMVHHKGTHRNWLPALRHITRFDDVDVPEPENRGSAARIRKSTVVKGLKDESDLKLYTDENRPRLAKETAKKSGLPGGEQGAYFRMTPEQRKAWDAAYDPKNKAFAAAKLTGADLVRWKYQRYLKDYLRTGLSVDESVKAIVDEVDALGLRENTVVIYSSDQGFYLGEHGWFDKRMMYEESFRAPLIIRWPGKIVPGAVSSDLCQNIDLAETFLDLAKAPIPGDMQGLSLVPLMLGQRPDSWRDSLYYHYYLYPGGGSIVKHEGVATKDMKLIRFYGKGAADGEEWELYDLNKDPSEMRSQYANPEFAPRVTDLKAKLQRLRMQYQVEKAQ
jgi:arylsulfatase A-like enzyme